MVKFTDAEYADTQNSVWDFATQSGICVKWNVKFKLKGPNNFRIFAFHWLWWKVINKNVKCE